MDRGACQATIHRDTRVRHSWVTKYAHMHTHTHVLGLRDEIVNKTDSYPVPINLTCIYNSPSDIIKWLAKEYHMTLVLAQKECSSIHSWLKHGRRALQQTNDICTPHTSCRILPRTLSLCLLICPLGSHNYTNQNYNTLFCLLLGIKKPTLFKRENR